MLVVITYDVNTETTAGRTRLRKVGEAMYKLWKKGAKLLYLSVFWIALKVLL